jgi:hypothetical protein
VAAVALLRAYSKSVGALAERERMRQCLSSPRGPSAPRGRRIRGTCKQYMRRVGRTRLAEARNGTRGQLELGSAEVRLAQPVAHVVAPSLAERRLAGHHLAAHLSAGRPRGRRPRRGARGHRLRQQRRPQWRGRRCRHCCARDGVPQDVAERPGRVRCGRSGWRGRSLRKADHLRRPQQRSRCGRAEGHRSARTGARRTDGRSQ